MAGTEKSILKLTKPSLLFLSKFSIFLVFFFFFFSLALFAAPPTTPHHALLNLDNINNNIIKLKPQTGNALFYHQVQVQVLMKMEELVSAFSMQQGIRRRLLSSDHQPGSWPPLCISKCDQCTPCKPVHVSVPPGTPVTTEYYPVAWRCKCGNKLYMP